MFTYILTSLVLFAIFDSKKTIAEPLKDSEWNQWVAPVNNDQIFQSFFNLFSHDRNIRQESLEWLQKNWREEYIPMILDILSLTNDHWIRQNLFDLLREKTGETFRMDLHAWLIWSWNREEKILPEYGDFKAILHSNIDPQFGTYFQGRTQQTKIRLDEVRWGGVKQDGIPPLRNPEMIPAWEADYLQDDHIVFGVEINGDSRAYPKRILAWHEMFTDKIGGVPVAGVYCTLCGSVIVYETTADGIEFELGTSGFLYRSNKLMYDKATQSLWNTLLGTPVIGPLIHHDIQLEARSVVTTTWGEWKRRHPDTEVLSVKTGFKRNYDEGEAYNEYFSTDQLMFPVPDLDPRLKNKQEVFIIRSDGFMEDPLAISTEFLADHPLYHDLSGDMAVVVLTDKTGANRSYKSRGIIFTSYDQMSSLIDENGNKWTVSESAIIGDKGQQLKRLPDHRAFWFGWYSMFPETRLVR